MKVSEHSVFVALFISLYKVVITLSPCSNLVILPLKKNLAALIKALLNVQQNVQFEVVHVLGPVLASS